MGTSIVFYLLQHTTLGICSVEECIMQRIKFSLKSACTFIVEYINVFNMTPPYHITSKYV